MALTQIPPKSTLHDQEFLQIAGPDSISTGYFFDANQSALYFKESQILIPAKHGYTHIFEDPVPDATCDAHGMMSADDKCKLDAMSQTRLGVLGFMGAGFPDDGGWLQGDIILAAGTEFINLERVANVIRLTVDSPIPLSCTCEECNQIFWVQDETSITAIRPPTCSGKLPGTNVYGEANVYLFPEATIVDPANPAATLNKKFLYPTLSFRRYLNSVTPGKGMIECVLTRNSVNTQQTQVGFVMTPGPDQGKVECVWFTDLDDQGNLTTFRLDPKKEPGLLGQLLYKGHLLTKQMAVIVDFTQNTLAANQYLVKLWDVLNHEVVGDPFTATNIWRYQNPENLNPTLNPQTLILDQSQDVLPVGTLIDLWFFEVGEINGEPIRRSFFNKQPNFNPTALWGMLGGVQFGDIETARGETEPGEESAGRDASAQILEIDDFEPTIWGLTGFQDPLFVFDDLTGAGTEGTQFNTQHRAVVDPGLPGLRVVRSNATEPFQERPVVLWNRIGTSNSQLIRTELGRPDDVNSFTPYDVLLHAPIDHFDGAYMRVRNLGIINGLNYITVSGVHFKDIPQSGTIRIIGPGSSHNKVWRYGHKLMWPSVDNDADVIALAGVAADDMPYPGGVGDVVELLQREWNAPCVRVQFSQDATGAINLQFKVGTLNMALPYEDRITGDVNDFVRGMQPGYAVSSVYTQLEPWSGVGPQPDVNFENYKLYEGGAASDGNEYWNLLEIMFRADQVWIWWNTLLITPNTALSQGLPTPVVITTPYFPAPPSQAYGKYGLRMWPGTKLRRTELRTQLRPYSEFTYGQLELKS